MGRSSRSSELSRSMACLASRYNQGSSFHALRLVMLLAESVGDRLAYHVIHRDLAGRNLSLAFAKIEFALDEAL